MFTAFAPVMHKADQFALQANAKGIDRINYLGLSVHFFFNTLIAFLPIYFGAEQARIYVQQIPQWIIDGFSIAGGIIPAIGFAMLLKIMMKLEYVMFLIIGFVLAAYLEMPILAIALIGLAIAMYDFYQNKNRKDSSVAGEEEMADGI